MNQLQIKYWRRQTKLRTYIIVNDDCTGEHQRNHANHNPSDVALPLTDNCMTETNNTPSNNQNAYARKSTTEPPNDSLVNGISSQFVDRPATLFPSTCAFSNDGDGIDRPEQHRAINFNRQMGK